MSIAFIRRKFFVSGIFGFKECEVGFVNVGVFLKNSDKDACRLYAKALVPSFLILKVRF